MSCVRNNLSAFAIIRMTETADPPATVRVRDLISIYEKKANDSTRNEHLRRRAKSLGNILSGNVEVKLNDLFSLEDVEIVLKQFETVLKFYEEYNKEKHVELQNKLFNILTSIVYVKSNSADDHARRKRLTKHTLNLVSYLNHKLPSNAALYPQNKFRYTTYDEFIQRKEQSAQTGWKRSQEFHLLPDRKSSEVNVNDVSVVSVKKLKEHFQLPDIYAPPNATRINTTEYKSEYSLILKNVDVTGSSTNKTNICVEQGLTNKIERNSKNDAEEEFAPQSTLSVSKLRKLFEEKTEENSKGLQLILNSDISEGSRYKYKVDSEKIENSAIISVEIPNGHDIWNNSLKYVDSEGSQEDSETDRSSSRGTVCFRGSPPLS